METICVDHSSPYLPEGRVLGKKEFCVKCKKERLVMSLVTNTPDSSISWLDCGHSQETKYNKPTNLPIQVKLEKDEPISTLNGTGQIYGCPICEKMVSIDRVKEENLSKVYYLQCGHYVQVASRVISKPTTQNTSERKPTNQPSLFNREIPTPEKLPIVKDDKWEKFLPYQKTGIEFIRDSGFRALIGDEMGLGKTIQVIGAMRYFPEEMLPILIVVPGAVTVKWQREIKKWFNDKFNTIEYAPFIHKESIGGLINDQKIYVISNGILAKPGMMDAIANYGFKTIVIDEAHQYKSKNTKRTKALFTLANKIPQIILLSGTSVMNNVMEYYNSLHLLRPRTWFSRNTLAYKCITDHKGKPLGLAPHYRDEFFEQTKGYILRREKSEVMKDLPTKFVNEEWIDFSTSKNVVNSYNKLAEELAEAMEGLEDESGMSQHLFGIISRLRHVVGTGKALRATEFVADKVISTDQKICIGVHHKLSMSILQDSLKHKHCPKCNNYTFECKIEEEGSFDVCEVCEEDISKQPILTPICISDENPEEKQKRLDKFREDEHSKILILSILGGGVGMDIQFCPNVLVLEKEWNRAIEAQFEGRFHRVGMTQQVTITYMLAQNTIDEFFLDLVRLKEEIVGSVLDINYESSPDTMYAIAQKVVQKRLKYAGA